MRELGDYLRQMRETRGLTLDDVSDAIKVRVKYLKALEDGNMEALPPEVYIRGFIKSYGEFLGVDLDDLYARYEESKPKKSGRGIFGFVAHRDEPPPPPVAHSIKDTIKPTELPKFIRDWRVWVAFAVVVIIVILLTVGGKGKNAPQIAENPLAEAFMDTSGNAQMVKSPISYEEVSQEVILPIGNINPSWAISRAESLTLSVRPRKESWLYVEADYKPVFKGTVKRGEKHNWRSKNAFFLTISHPELFEIKLNGFKLKPLTPPQGAYAMDVELTRANILGYLEEYKKAELPPILPYKPGINTVDTSGSTRIERPAPPKEHRTPTKRRTTKKKTTPKIKAASKSSATPDTGKPAPKPLLPPSRLPEGKSSE